MIITFIINSMKVKFYSILFSLLNELVVELKLIIILSDSTLYDYYNNSSKRLD